MEIVLNKILILNSIEINASDIEKNNPIDVKDDSLDIYKNLKKYRRIKKCLKKKNNFCSEKLFHQLLDDKHLFIIEINTDSEIPINNIII